VVRGGKLIPWFNGAIIAAAGLLVTLFARDLVTAFMKEPTQEVVALGVRYVQVVLPFLWTYAVFNTILSFVNGLGKVRYTTAVNLLMLWAVRVPIALAIHFFGDGEWIMICYPISYTFAMLCMLAYYLTPAWKRYEVLAAKERSV